MGRQYAVYNRHEVTGHSDEVYVMYHPQEDRSTIKYTLLHGPFDTLEEAQDAMAEHMGIPNWVKRSNK